MTPTTPMPIRRRGAQPQALLPRRRSRRRKPRWPRVFWWRARHGPSPARSAPVKNAGKRRVVSAQPRDGAGSVIASEQGRAGAPPRRGAGSVTEYGRVGARRPSRAERRATVVAPAARSARLLAWASGQGRAAATRARRWPSTTRRRGAVPAARHELEAAVPEVIDVLRASVAAGINPRRALQAAAEGAPPALVPVLRQAIQAAELGSGAGQALATTAAAERLTELALAGEALDLAESTGAPPGPVLAGVAVAAADRVRTRQARMAATAQARLSARVVAAMAPAFLGVLTLTAPSEAAFLVREPLGWATLAAALTFELLGVAWSAHIIRGPVR
jgi:type II secretion system (T2SS) protein F